MVDVPLGNGTCKLGILEVCNSDKDELTEQIQAVYMMGLGAVLLGIIAGHLMHRTGLHALPESLVTVIMGALLGVVLWASPVFGAKYSLSVDLVQVLFTWMLNFLALPIIIFESGWSLRLRDFVSQFGYIMFFAIIGTIVSVVVVGLLMHQAGHLYGISDWRTCFAYAALISSVDPVATLATFGSLNVDPLLFILVFGESQINDAVAITLFRALNKHSVKNPFDLCGTMVIVLFGSIAVGMGLAMLFIVILRFTHLGSSSESLAPGVMLVFVSCFFTFQVGEKLGLSGIIAVLFNSILMGAYCPSHLSAEGMTMASYLLKQMSGLADTLIFLMSGVLAVYVVASGGVGLTFGLLMSLFCLVGRFCAVVPLGLLSNGIKRIVGRRVPREKQLMISPSHLFMMWHSGLRGGVSLSLVMELGSWVDEGGHDGNKGVLINGTFVLVVLYLLCFGSTTGFFLRLLGLPLGSQVDRSKTLYEKSDKSGWAWRSLKCLRTRLFLPILVGTTQRSLSDDHAMGEVIREAEEIERDLQDGMTDRAPARRKNMMKTGTRNRLCSSLMQIFGTTDPAHVGAFEDIMQDMRTNNSLTASTTSDEASDEESVDDDDDDDDDDDATCPSGVAGDARRVQFEER